MKDTLGRYINQELLSDRGQSAGVDDDLLGGGLVDSLGMMSLVFFIEEEFGVEVPPEDVTIENFFSIRTIERYLSDRTS